MLTVGVIGWNIIRKDGHDEWNPFKVHFVVSLMWILFTIMLKAAMLAQAATLLQDILRLTFGIKE